MSVTAKRLLVLSVALASAPSFAITFSAAGSSIVSGAALAASADFSVSGNNLIVTLTNTSVADVTLQPDVLTAVFFDVSGALLGLTPAIGSAVVPGGSSVLFGTTDAGGVVGGEWAYGEGISGALSAGTGGLVSVQRYGISSAGFGVFGSASFPGSNLSGPNSVNGVQYGITSAGDNPLTGQTAVTGSNALIKNRVVFTLPGLPNSFDVTRVGSVFFQYGTALTPTDPGLNGSVVPEPATLLAVGLGLIALGRRRSK